MTGEATTSEGYAIYSKVASNAVRNAIFFGIGAVILRFFAGSMFGKIGMWIFVGIVCLDVIHGLVGAIAAVVALSMKIKAGGLDASEKWLIPAQVVRLADMAVGVFLAWWVMRANGYFGGSA